MQWPLQSLCLRVESISVVHLAGLDAQVEHVLMHVYICGAVVLHTFMWAKHCCFTAQVFESYSEEQNTAILRW